MLDTYSSLIVLIYIAYLFDKIQTQNDSLVLILDLSLSGLSIQYTISNIIY